MPRDFRTLKICLLTVILGAVFLLYFAFWPQADFELTLSNERKMFVYEKMIVELRRRQSKKCVSYCKRPETEHVDCGRVLQGDKNYIKTLTGSSRIPLIEDPHLDMSCKALKSRIFPEHLKLKLRLLSAGVAFARIVYRDYEFIERQVQVSYHPQNLFCFAVDKKAPIGFQEKIRRLEECFENVIVLPATETYDSEGHNYSSANLRCMKALLPYTSWTYLLLLQNHDVVTKSIFELEKIYKLLGGANDIGVGTERAGRRRRGFKWDPRSLRLFRNESEVPEEVLRTPVTISTGYSQGSLSRGAVEWMVEKVDLTRYIEQWNHTNYASDEQFLSTFQANPQLKMPGHFTDECMKRGIGIDQISRMTQWNVGDPENCVTGAFRHDICIIGIENLKPLSKMPTIMFNKMIPSFDYSIIECTAELLYNRTFLGQVDQKLDEEYYKNMVNVIYHKNHLDPDYRLNCTPSYTPWGLPMKL